MATRNDEEIKTQLRKLQEQRNYLDTFLGTLYKGDANKQKVDQALIPLNREIRAIEWVLNENDGLPF